MVAMIILNMFIGIITKYFEEVHDELKHRVGLCLAAACQHTAVMLITSLRPLSLSQDRWKTSTMSWEAETWISFKSRCMKNRICWGRRRRAVDSKERKRELENVLALYVDAPSQRSLLLHSSLPPLISICGAVTLQWSASIAKSTS